MAVEFKALAFNSRTAAPTKNESQGNTVKESQDVAAGASSPMGRPRFADFMYCFACVDCRHVVNFAALDVLAEHHRVLSGICSDPSMGSTDNDTTKRPRSSSSAKSTRLANLQLSFAQYCISLSTLILYGSPTQQFEYLFHAYAVESERGITRTEIFQLLQDHFYKRPEPQYHHIHAEPKSKQDPETDARHFECLYTWLKKHMAVYDRTRCGFLPLSTALEMLHVHPSALQHLQLQIDALSKKMHENNTKYHEKAAAAQIDEQLAVGSTVVGDE